MTVSPFARVSCRMTSASAQLLNSERRLMRMIGPDGVLSSLVSRSETTAQMMSS